MSFGRKLGRLGSAGPSSRPAHVGSGEAALGPSPGDAPERDPTTAESTDRARIEPPESPEPDRWDAFRSALRSKAAREERRPVVSRELATMALPGEVLATEHGPLHRILDVQSLDGAHCGVVHRDAIELDPRALSRFALDESFDDVDPARMVYLDTETTGLAGGAGTVAFLVGVAYVADGAMHVEQWLLRRFGEEGPILRRLAELLEGASALVTYNGKSFDWPLLRARYVLSRLPLPPIARHLDIVHGARRLLSSRLPSVRLMDVERELLGFVRRGDIDAALIPEIFLEFQRTGSHPDMTRVIEHHALDLRAMPAILSRFAGWMGTGTGAGIHASEFGTRLGTGLANRPDDARDRLACARVAARSGHDGDARRLVASMLDDLSGELASVGALLSAKQARKAGDHVAERVALERAVATAPDDDVRLHALLALAKHLEHRAKDLEAALAAAREAHGILADEAVAARIERLERRVSRDRKGAGRGTPELPT